MLACRQESCRCTGAEVWYGRNIVLLLGAVEVVGGMVDVVDVSRQVWLLVCSAGCKMVLDCYVAGLPCNAIAGVPC